MPFQPLKSEELVSRLAAIVDSSEDAIIGADQQGIIQIWNAAATQLFGFSPEEMLGQSILLMVPPELHAQERERLKRLQAGERIQQHETVRIAKGGARIGVCLSIFAIQDSEGSRIGAAMMMRDLSTRQRENAAQARLAAIIESSEDAIVAKDLNGVVTDWNAAAERMFGYTKEEIVGRSILTIIPPELQHEEAGILSKIKSGQPVEHFRTQRLHKSGRRLEVSLTISPIRDPNGNVIGASKIARDVTEQVRHDKDLLMLAAIVESSDDAIISKNLDGIITSWNKSAERMFGYKAEEIIGHSVMRLIPPELHHEELMILSKMRTGERLDHYETRRRKKNGEVVDISLTVSPIRNQMGQVIGVSKIVRDISDRKLAEAMLLEQEKLAAVGRMAATLAHEVNNPLESIMNLAYILSEDPLLPPTPREHARVLLNEVQRAGDITRQVLTYYREARVPGEIRIAESIEQVLAAKSKKLADKRIEVQEELESVCIQGIAGELRQLFDNLIENAIDACRPGGKIRIRARGTPQSLPSQVVVTIADDGSGIPAELRRRIFQPFYTTKQRNGSGLGLWVALGIAQKHGGTIRVRSREGERCSGSVFRISLSASAVPQVEPSTAIPALEPASR